MNRTFLKSWGSALIRPIRAARLLYFFSWMRDGFVVVAVGFLHDPAVVVRMILRAESRLTVVLAAGRQRGVIELPYGSAILGRECDMYGSVRFALGQPQGRRVLGPEA